MYQESVDHFSISHVHYLILQSFQKKRSHVTSIYTYDSCLKSTTNMFTLSRWSSNGALFFGYNLSKVYFISLSLSLLISLFFFTYLGMFSHIFTMLSQCFRHTFIMLSHAFTCFHMPSHIYSYEYMRFHVQMHLNKL